MSEPWITGPTRIEYRHTVRIGRQALRKWDLRFDPWNRIYEVWTGEQWTALTFEILDVIARDIEDYDPVRSTETWNQLWQETENVQKLSARY